MTKAVYDPIAQEYKDSKLLPFRIHVERYMIFSLFGDLKERTVLDLACGEGIYSRRIKSLGAKAVTGVDISTEMIALAEAEEKKDPQGIRYVAQDATTFQGEAPFDFVLGSYLLNYAKSWDEILAFCQGIYRNLKPGGSFVGFNDNPANDPKDFQRYRKYGFYKTTPENRREGDPVTYHIINPNGTEFSFNNYYLSPDTYERAFATAGFREFQWHQPRLAPGAEKEFAPDFWKDYLDFPPMVGITAKR